MSSQSAIPTLHPNELKKKQPGDYIVRFVFGASISLIAALVGLKYQLFGGLFLAFPAILPASLTLVERDAGRREATVDAQGAIMGSAGLVAFALVAASGIKPWGAIPALIAASVTWLAVSVAIYVAVMAWRAVTEKPRGRA